MGSVSEAEFSEKGAQPGENLRDDRALGNRERVPAIGLKEYWYPALPEKKVGRKKPVEVKLLGERLTFFRDDKDEVVAVHATCPHRGASLSFGTSHFKGTLTCPYHGWTFDAKGNCLAVLGEGPGSTIPGAKGTKVRDYPTRTLKGIVFVWMGDGPAAPIEEDIAWELFDPNIAVMSSQSVWNANWRPGIENFLDAHVYYVHRNSAEVLIQPTGGLLMVLHQGTTRPELHAVNERLLCVKPGGTSTLDYVDREKGKAAMREFQDVFPALGGAKWPPTRARLYASKVFGLFRGLFKPRPPLSTDPEWGTGMHLPATMHFDFRLGTFTRCQVPIDEHSTRQFFFCSWRARNAWQRLFWAVYFNVWFDWKHCKNFSGQDAVMAEISDYSAPERLSSTDVFMRTWRRFVLEHARDFKRRKQAG